MERRAFELLYESESSWWYEGRALVSNKVLKCFQKKDHSQKVADVGAGFGGMFPILSAHGIVDAFEPDNEARSACKERGYNAVDTFDSEHTLPKDAYDLIALCDVLEHIKEDEKFLLNLAKTVRTRGGLLLTVPAFQSLWSAHDVEHHHYRRYRKHELVSLLERSGFTVHYAGYWNMLLFIPALIVRLTGRSGSSSLSMPRMLDRLFFLAISLESLLIPYLSLPFGTGLIVYATRSEPT
jgi:SAM-dependent methyltransferase